LGAAPVFDYSRFVVALQSKTNPPVRRFKIDEDYQPLAHKQIIHAPSALRYDINLMTKQEE
jgi:hypothetical protein